MLLGAQGILSFLRLLEVLTEALRFGTGECLQRNAYSFLRLVRIRFRKLMGGCFTIFVSEEKKKKKKKKKRNSFSVLAGSKQLLCLAMLAVICLLPL